jgi:DNA-binding NarL/FixJ family response regulator
LLSLEHDFEVVGEAASAAEGVVVVARHSPDIVITDLALPGTTALTIIPELKEADPNLRVLVLSAHCTDEYVRAALESGADGYVLKDASRAELVEGIRTVLRGRQFFSKAVTSTVISGYLGRDGKPNLGDEGKLTSREREVLKLIAMANSTKQIAGLLDLSVKTVEKHRSNLMRKLELHNTAAVTLYAIRNKMVPIDTLSDDEGPELAGDDSFRQP